MAKVLIDENTLTAMADEVRVLAGTSDKLTTDEMINYTKDANDEIDTQVDLIQQITNALRDKSSAGGSSEFPEGYKRCDFIQFNGNSWIDTGIIGNQDTQINAYFTWENSTQRHLFGCASEDNSASITSYMNGQWRFGDKATSKSFSTKNPMLPYSVLMNKTTISTTNSVASISGVNDFETIGTILLGGCRNADGTVPSVGIVGKIYYFALWQGEEQVRKFVPVTNGNGSYRFFDVVSKKFFDSITNTPLEGGG